jgi:hypothetical protein
MRSGSVPAPLARGVQGEVVEPVEEPLEARLVQILRRHVTADGGVDLGQVAVPVDLAAGNADDPAVIRHLAVAIPVVERRQKLAAGQIAGASEDDQIEAFDRNDSCGHGFSLLIFSVAGA